MKWLVGNGAARKRLALADRFWSKVVKTRGCWRWTGAKNERGYGVIGVGGRRTGNFKAHRVSYELHVGPIPDGLCVCHLCNNPECTNPKHLYLATHAENMRDAARDGLMGGNEGEKNGTTRLTEEQARRLRQPMVRGELTRLAREYGITIDHASRIRHGRKWRHLEN